MLIFPMNLLIPSPLQCILILSRLVLQDSPGHRLAFLTTLQKTKKMNTETNDEIRQFKARKQDEYKTSKKVTKGGYWV